MRRHRSLATHIFAIMAILVAMVIVIFAVAAKQALDRRSVAARNLATIQAYRDLLIAKERIRVEQGAISAALDDPLPAEANMLSYIDQARSQAEQTFRDLVARLQARDFTGQPVNLAGLIARHRAYDQIFNRAWTAIHQSRIARDKTLSTLWPAQGAALVDGMEIESTMLANQIEQSDSVIAEMSKVSVLAWSVRDVAGTDRRHVGVAIGKGGVLSPQDRLTFAEASGRIDAPWEVMAYDMQLPSTPGELKAAHARAQKAYFQELVARRNAIVDTLSEGRSPNLTGLQWWKISEPALSSIAAISLTALDLMQAHVAAQAALANQNLYLFVCSMLVILGFVLLVSGIIAIRVIRPLAMITDRIQTVAAGDLGGQIPFTRQNDEIGKLARALQMFRDNAADRRRLETELIKNQIAKEAAEASSRARGQFFANMSHELRTPLNAIIGFSELMRQQLFGPLGGRYGEYATLINSSGQHLLDLVSDILDISKMEAGKFVLDFRSVDLVKALDGSLRMVEKRAQDNGISLTRERPRDLTFIGDERATKQILLNLLSNAVKFTPPGGDVHVAMTAEDGRVRISVQDTGIGIPADALSRLGRAFEQVSNDPALAREGAGLGLALVRALVELHGGSLTIKSDVGVGTLVVVEIPQTQEQRTKAA